MKTMKQNPFLHCTDKHVVFASYIDKQMIFLSYLLFLIVYSFIIKLKEIFMNDVG